MPEEKPTADLLEDALDAIREALRVVTREASLRVVAKEVGVSHTALRDFIRVEAPRTPYGETRRKLFAWAAGRGMRLVDAELLQTQRRAVAERGPRYAAVPASIPPRAYKLIYDYTQLLADAGVPEEAIEEARRLMSGQTFNTLRAHMIDDRDEEGWVKDVKAAWALIKSELRRQGFDL